MQTDDTKYKFFKLNRRSQTYSVRSSSIFHSIFESLAYKMEEIHESCRIFFLKPRRQLIFWTQTGGGSGVGTFAARPEKSSKESGSARPRSSTCPTGPTRPIPLPRGDFTSDKVNNIDGVDADAGKFKRSLWHVISDQTYTVLHIKSNFVCRSLL